MPLISALNFFSFPMTRVSLYGGKYGGNGAEFFARLTRLSESVMSFLSWDAQEIFHFIRSSNISPRVSGTDYYFPCQERFGFSMLNPFEVTSFQVRNRPRNDRFSASIHEATRNLLDGFEPFQLNSSKYPFENSWIDFSLASPSRISLKFSWRSYTEIVDSPVERNSAEGGLANAT